MKKTFSKKLLFFGLIFAFLSRNVRANEEIFKCSPDTLQQLCKSSKQTQVCALDDDDQYLTIKSACQACGYEDTISYTMGPCQCPKTSCRQGYSCLDGKCLNFQNLDEKQLSEVAQKYISQQKNQQAMQILQKLLLKEEQNDYNYYLASLASFGQQKYKESLGYIKKAISISPDVSGYYIIRGRAFAEDNNFQQAQKQFKKVLDMGFDDIGLISYYQAQNLLKNQKNEEAIQKFQEAIKYHPQKTQWYVRKAMAHAINKEEKMALLTCRQGLKVDPGNQQIILFMKQFQSIDEGKQNDIEMAQEETTKYRQNSKPMDPDAINKILRQRKQQEQLAFDLQRIEQKNKQKLRDQMKKTQRILNKPKQEENLQSAQQSQLKGLEKSEKEIQL